MPMLSPISGLIAEAVLQRLEAKVFQTLTPKLWKRCVDDTFVILDTDKLSDFHIVLNNTLLGIQQFRKFVIKSPCPEEAFYFQTLHFSLSRVN